MTGRHGGHEALRSLGMDEFRHLRRGTPSFVEPMRATLVDAPFSGPDWAFERKFDGVRLLAVRRDGKVRLYTRSGRVADAQYPEVAQALEEDPDADTDAVFDGEVVAFEGTRTSFPLLQRRMHATPDAHLLAAVPVHYYLFDLLHLDGYDTGGLPLFARKRLLSQCVRFGDTVRATPHRRGDGDAAFHTAEERGWEGLIAKRLDAPYESRRSRSWLKIKCIRAQEFVIGGYTAPKGSRSGFGALLLGYHERGRLRYAGKVGTGFDTAFLERLTRVLQLLRRETSPFSDPVPERETHWVVPRLVCEVAYTEWTPDGRLRHPTFRGLREDKPADAIVREEATPVGAAER